ncbi:dynein axonemal heavy chain 10-like [Panulirus ornatus]|uniref:dynein axonemal heavy chain 10-like n=1 Tax=Panulirus ornatus TaxID=150431 RepID=UPI003A852A7C
MGSSLGFERYCDEYYDFIGNYGSVDTDDPRSVEHFLLEVFQPLLLATPAVPPALAHYRHLVGLPRLLNLLGAQLIYHVGAAMQTPRLFLPSEVLALPDDPQELRQLPLDVAFLNRTEELVLHWVEQIHAYAFDQGDASSPLELGLLHEIRQLSKKGELLKKLLDQVESREVRKVLDYLDCQSSPFTILIHQAVDNLRMVQKRVKETGGQLVHLETQLDQLYTDSVQALTEHMYDVLALLRIIWMHSDHYHKQEVMTELCVRVSWEVTRACQVHLPLDSLFSPSTWSPTPSKTSAQEDSKIAGGKDSLALVEVAIKCCKEWRNCYTELARHFGEQDRPEVWLPDTHAVFLPVELFVSRCEDLKYIGLSKVQLTRKICLRKRLSEQNLSEIVPASAKSA